MKLNLTKFAMVGVCALGIAMHAGTAAAQVDFEAGTPETIAITAEVNNTITATVTDPDMGVWGVIRSNVAGENALLQLTTAGLQVGTADVGADAIEGGGPPVAGLIAIAAAFPSTPINVTFSTPVDLTCALCTGGNPPLQLINLAAELTPPAVGVTGTDAALDVLLATNTTGVGTTTAGGAMNFTIGATAQTTVGATAYESGDYAGSFDLMLEY